MLMIAALWPPAARATTPALTAADVTRIIGQAVAEARAVGLPVAIAVVDHEGNVLGTHTMSGARTFTVAGSGRPAACGQPAGFADVADLVANRRPDCGVEGLRIPPVPVDADPLAPIDGALLAAVSKAGTAAFFSTQGNAFSTRTASYIVQEHFPPGVTNAASGPLFGVQFSQLPCGDVVPRAGAVFPAPLPALPAGTLPLGLAGDPGGLPLYVQGRAAGGVGVEGNGSYGVDRDPTDGDVPREERIALAATAGFAAPTEIRGDRILVGGLRFPFANADPVARPAASWTVGPRDVAPRDAPPSRFVHGRLAGVRGSWDPRWFAPVHDGTDPSPADGGLAAAEVERILARAARQADRTRAAIRRPLGDRARVNVTVVDRGGAILGQFRTADAPVFGVDVSAQKARTAVFLSGADAGATLAAADAARRPLLGALAGLDGFVTAARREGIALDGGVAFTDRAGGFLSRPFFPDGIDGTRNGPFSRPFAAWSPFTDGLQVELVLPGLVFLLTKTPAPPAFAGSCTGVPGLGNGMQIFPGSVPLYRRGRLVGAIGVSGDGVDQDDAVALAGSRGFAAPPRLRADRVQVRGVRLPWVKRPRRVETR